MAEDAGDAAAQEAQQTISQAISMLMYRSGMGKMAGRGMQSLPPDTIGKEPSSAESQPYLDAGGPAHGQAEKRPVIVGSWEEAEEVSRLIRERHGMDVEATPRAKLGRGKIEYVFEDIRGGDLIALLGPETPCETTYTKKGIKLKLPGIAQSKAEANPESQAGILEVAVDNEEDFDFIKDVLDRNNVEYTVSHEYAEDATWSLANKTYSDGAQIAIFELPDRDIEPKATIHVPFSKTDHVIAPSDHPWTQLKDLDPEVIGLFGFFTRDALASKLALRQATEQIGFDGALKDLPAFEPGKQGNLSLDFTTVKWDPNALIMSDPLDRMGVPYALHIGDGIARFEFSSEAAPAVKAVTDWHLGHAESKISKSRFPDYDRLQAAAEGQGVRSELVEVTVKDQTAAALFKEELKYRGVAFESIFSKTTNEETFLARAEEIRTKAPELEKLRLEYEAGQGKERASKLMNRRKNQAVKNEKVAAKGKTVKAKPQSESKVSSHRTQTPSRDQAIAQKSVAARRASHSQSFKKAIKHGR